MNEFASLLSALASLAWPALVFYVFYKLQSEIKIMIVRIKKGKIFGQEIELGEQLEKLEAQVESVKALEIREMDATPEQSISYRDEIYQESSISELGAFLRVSSRLEIILKQKLAQIDATWLSKSFSIMTGFRKLNVGVDIMK